jgi:Ca2+-binding EF-hand superfamily protein
MRGTANHPLSKDAMPAAMILLLAAAAQAAAPTSGHGRPFISPMGEPFIGGSGVDGLTQWFETADLNHDGMITAVEMQLDSQRFFTVLDADHNGHIDPDEIDHYENVIEPEVRFARARMIDAGGGQSTGHGHGHGYGAGGWEGGGDDGDDEESGASEFGLLKIPEPVASADRDFSRDVSADEFRRAANDRFQLLDTTHSGRLTLAQLEALSDAARSEAHKGRHRSKPDDSPPPLPTPGNDGSGY